MNKHCSGDYFKVSGKRYYRCLYDGSIHAYVEGTAFEVCPKCERPIKGRMHGIVPVSTELRVSVRIPGIGETIFSTTPNYLGVNLREELYSG